MQRFLRRGIGLLLLAALTLLAGSRVRGHAVDPGAFEVWAIDQSDTTPVGGGTLYIYDGASLAGNAAGKAVPEAFDLGGAAQSLCLLQTGTAGRRPHMMFFSPDASYAILSYVTTGHVLFMEAVTRLPVAAIDVGVQAHAAVPSPDGTYVLVANQNGKLLQRINTHYPTASFVLDNAATLNLAAGTTPSGALRQDPVLRPDNAPICAVIEASSRFGFVTLRGGGMFVIDCTTTPMSIVAEYDRANVHPAGCGGVQTAGKMYINSGLEAAPHSDLYAFPLAAYSTTPNPPNTPAPSVVFSHDGQGVVDSHGTSLTKHDRYLWVADRASNRISVVDTATDRVVNQFGLAGELSPDPAPDLIGIAPSGNRMFATLRGPIPLTANNPLFNNAVGSTPGVGVLRVEQGGRHGVFQSIAPISHLVAGVERADPHAIGIRLK